jgi:hypothetical protein
MARYRILSWQDIPAQVKVFREEAAPLSRALSDRFMAEIDRAAMRLGLVGSDEYLEQWAWSDDLEREGEPEAVLAAVVAELEATFEAVRERNRRPPRD